MLKIKKILLLTFIMLIFFTPVAALNSDMDLDAHDYQFIVSRSNNWEKEINYDHNYNTYYGSEIESYHEYYKKYSTNHKTPATGSRVFEYKMNIVDSKNFKTLSYLNCTNNDNLNIKSKNNSHVANDMEIDMFCNTAHTSKFNGIVEDYEKNWRYEIVSKPNYGKIKINSDGTFTYLPYINFCGRDCLSYIVTNGKYKSNIATLIINVNKNKCV